MLIELIKAKLRYRNFKIEYLKRNKHNYTVPSCFFRLEKIKIGKATYGSIFIYDNSDSETRVEIGNFCSIAPEVKFILGSDHPTQFISMYPFKVMLGMLERESLSKGSIVVKDDVWIGTNSLILSGVTIGQGAIVAAGSVVTKDVPPYSIVAGVPAKVIKFRFPKEIREKLIKVNYSELDLENIRNNIVNWYVPVTLSNVDELTK